MATVMTVVGILVFVLGLLFSIAWHELGHLSTAKLFGIRVPQYMVGFGPTVWSRKKGETEYGLKAVPLGGYIRMIGMFPPGADGRITQRSTSPWRSMIEDAREASYEEVKEGDESRLFYTRKPWKRVIVMFAGPFMNLLLSFGLFLTVMMGFGVSMAVPTIGTVSECVVKAGQATDTCPADAPAAPAFQAGLRPGDRVVSFDGDRIGNYEQLQGDIRKSAGKKVELVVERDGQRLTLEPTIAVNDVQKYDGEGLPVKGETVRAASSASPRPRAWSGSASGSPSSGCTTWRRTAWSRWPRCPARSPGCGTRWSTAPRARWTPRSAWSARPG